MPDIIVTDDMRVIFSEELERIKQRLSMENRIITEENIGKTFKVVLPSDGNFYHEYTVGDIVVLLDSVGGTRGYFSCAGKGNQYLTEGHVKLLDEELLTTIPESKYPTLYHKYWYAVSKQLGRDGYSLTEHEKFSNSVVFNLMEEARNIVSMVEFKSELNKTKAEVRVMDLFKGYKTGNSVCDFIKESFQFESTRHDYRYGLVIAKTVGYNVKFDYENKSVSILSGDEQKNLTVKAFGRKFGFNKLPEWSIIAEKLSYELNKDVKIEYFTKYEDLEKYYTMSEVSGESCMRHDFEGQPYHPCIVYAHDAAEVLEDYHQEYSIYVSDHIKLAVLFINGEPTARCMVDTKHHYRGKAFGEGSSTLSKLLGYSDVGISGCVNIIKYNKGYIMPYIDGCDYVCEDSGCIGEGDIGADSTDGHTNPGVWSEYHDRYIDENYTVWSDYHEDYFEEDCEEIVYVNHDYYLKDCEEVCYSEHSEEWFLTDECYYLDFKDDWIHSDDVEDVCMEHISYSATVNELVEFCNNI